MTEFQMLLNKSKDHNTSERVYLYLSASILYHLKTMITILTITQRNKSPTEQEQLLLWSSLSVLDYKSTRNTNVNLLAKACPLEKPKGFWESTGLLVRKSLTRGVNDSKVGITVHVNCFNLAQILQLKLQKQLSCWCYCMQEDSTCTHQTPQTAEQLWGGALWRRINRPRGGRDLWK